MIEFSQRLQSLLSQPAISPFYCVAIGDYKTTTFHSPITLSNGEAYQADGKVFSLDPPSIGSIVDRAQYKIGLADPNQEFASKWAEKPVGGLVTVRACLVDLETRLPETDVANTFIVYRGRVDGITFSAQGTDAILTVSCASPVMALQMSKSILTTSDSARKYNPSDAAFDQVYEGAGVIQVKWGK